MPENASYKVLNPYLERPQLPLPVYVLLPVSGEREHYSGLARTALEDLVIPRPCNNFDPPVQSRLFRKAGTKRWNRLIILSSLLEYLSTFPIGEPTPQKGGRAPKLMISKAPKVTTPRRRRTKMEVPA
jgi:hypothetical protein